MPNVSKNIVASALLFGGTLGLGSAANAGLAVTLIDNFTTGFGSGYTTQSGAGILGTRGVDNLGTPLSFQNPGFKWSGNAYNNGTVEYFNFGTLDFTNLALTMTGSGSGTGNATLQVTLFNSNNSYAGWNVAFSNSMTMSTSAFTFTGKFDPQASAFDLSQVTVIQVMTAGSGSSTVNYTMTNFSYSAVPAPGAVALLGVSGLVVARRRKA